MQIRKRLTYANVMSSLAVFLVLGGATAFAASQVAKKSVGTKQLKKNAVGPKKLKKNSVRGKKVKNHSLTGVDINLDKLGTVPSAANLVGHTPFFVRLGFGQSQVLATNGSVSLVADCFNAGGFDEARILEQTSVNGAVANGSDDWNGGPAPADFLNVDTPATDREFVSNSETEGEVDVSYDIDEGFVLGPDGKMLTVNSEGVALGLNYGAPGCLFAGVINAVG